MTPLEFLQFVLPVSGHYVRFVLKPGSKTPWQTPYDTIEELHESIEQLKQQPGMNIYYAVSSFKDRSCRTQENALMTKALFLDVDCGPEKPYADWREGLRALNTYVVKADMPKPMIVRSGNGLHVYWVFTEEMPSKEWKVLAEGFKQSLRKHGFVTDMSVPADHARVMRPIGTVNPKGGGTVKIIINGGPYDSAIFVQKFIGVTQNINAVAIPAHIAKRTTLINTLMPPADLPLAHPAIVAEKCKQIEWGVANQAKVAEPFWYAMLGVAAHCLDSDATAEAWSKDHPEFNQAATLAKMEQWKKSTTGPATCAKFKDERPKGCNDCKFKDRITTPVQLGVSAEEVPLPDDAPDKTAFEVPMPWPFKRVEGKIVKVVEKTDIDVCNFHIYPVSYGKDEALNYEVVRYRWKRLHVGWTDLVLRQAYLNEGAAREFATALADQGIVLKSTGSLGLFQEMLRAYMEELRKMRSLTNLYQSMGWKENNTKFLLGTTMLERLDSGELLETDMAMSGAVGSSAQEMYHEQGTLAQAVAATSVLERFKMYIHMFAIGVSLSAPLYRFTGLDGVVINLWGDTGAGKTLAQNWMQSMWGDPRLLHFTAQFTQNALFSRLGFHCHLPMTIDEAARMQAVDVGQYLLMVTQGREKIRLDKNSREKLARIWGTPTVTSANKPFANILQSYGAEHEAQLMRLLDIPIGPHILFTSGTGPGERIYREIHSNFGHIGPALLRHWMKLGEAAMIQRIDAHKKKFELKYGYTFAGRERYWQLALVTADLAMEDARALGLLLFDHEPAMRYVMEQVGILKANVVDARLDSFDILNDYHNEHVSETVTIMHTGAGKGVFDINRPPRGSVFIRHDVFRADIQTSFTDGTMTIDRRHLKNWLAGHGTDLKTVMEDMTRAGVVIPVTNDKAVLTKDTPIRMPQVRVIKLDLKHPRFKGILDDVDDAVDTALQNKLVVVK